VRPGLVYGQVRVSYPLAARRVGRVFLVHIVVGDLRLIPPAGAYGVDLEVSFGSVFARIDYLLAVGRVVGVEVVRAVVGELSLATPVGVDGVDLKVFSAIPARINYLAVLARKGSLRLL
jgi:hypothetical protein